MMRKVLLCAVTLTIAMGLFMASSHAGDNMFCKDDADCPDGYICKKATYRMMGECLEEPKPVETIPIYTGGFESKLTRDTVNKFLNMPIPFKDDNLKKAVNQELEKPASSDITVEECMKLTELSSCGLQVPEEEEIKDLYGIQFCSNLTKISLTSHKIESLSPIENLTKLTDINFHGNNIKSLTPIKELTNLKGVRVGLNKIENINPPLFADLPLTLLDVSHNPLKSVTFLSALQTKLMSFSVSRGEMANSVFEEYILDSLSPDLTHLALFGFDMSEKISIIPSFEKIFSLYLVKANIDDISELAQLKELMVISLYNNQISDLTPLIHLENLEYIDLMVNKVDSIAPLVVKAQEGLFDSGESINVGFNPLSDNAFDWHVEILESFGIYVYY